MKKISLKPEGQMLRGVAYRLIETLAPMSHSSIWKLICAISICNILTVRVHLSSTPSISGPGSATDKNNKVGRSKPPPVLTGCLGQYAEKWSKRNTNLIGQVKILSGCFSGELRNSKAADITLLKLRFL